MCDAVSRAAPRRAPISMLPLKSTSSATLTGAGSDLKSVMMRGCPVVEQLEIARLQVDDRPPSSGADGGGDGDEIGCRPEGRPPFLCHAGRG